MRDTDAVLDLGSGSGKVCYIAAQVVGIFGSRAALNYMIVSDAGKPFGWTVVHLVTPPACHVSVKRVSRAVVCARRAMP